MRPYFSVGEEVIIQSERLPQYNGPAVISSIKTSGESFIDPLSDLLCIINNSKGPYLYVFEGMTEYSEKNQCERSAFFGQRSLRKKPEPGEDWETIKEKMRIGELA